MVFIQDSEELKKLATGSAQDCEVKNSECFKVLTDRWRPQKEANSKTN
jgi:hypothetical protein